jgi:hypothetical protein
MAVSTTQSIWRSGGGDQTRTAYCGSGMMVAMGYVADASVATPADILVTDPAVLPNPPALILPQYAIITAISVVGINGTAGAVDIGATLLSTGVNTPDYIMSNLDITAASTVTLGASGVNYAAIPSLAKLTAVDSGSGAGSFTVIIQYYVADVLFGQQSA